MDQFRLEAYGVNVRKKRSLISRRPRVFQMSLSLDSHSQSDEVNKGSSDENSSGDATRRKGMNLNQNGFSNPSNQKRHSEGVLAPANWKQSAGSLDIDGITSRVKRVKLKVCGISRTIQSKSIADDLTGPGSSSKSRQKFLHQDDSNERNPHGGEQSDEPLRKSKRVPKKRVLDGAFDEEENDDEIGYLEKLRTSKAAFAKKSLEEDSSRKKVHPISRVYKNGKHDDVKKKPKSDDTDYEEEVEDEDLMVSDSKKLRKQRKDQTELMTESKREPALTTRQRAILSSSSAQSVEFPNGLPSAPSRKQKEKLSEVEQQLKKAEAAQKRRIQVEKAARESEAEAIKKILGQDSSRKKREDKAKKRQEELAQEKAANALKLASSTVRTVIGPDGTTVTFPSEMGLPSIFDKPKGYPPAREICAGPSCNNPYKYRHSKLKLPLCSLKCYKAVELLETKEIVEGDGGKELQDQQQQQQQRPPSSDKDLN